MTTSRPAESKESFIDLANQTGHVGREDFQYGWHVFVGRKFANATILDVGAGLGHSRERLSVNNIVMLQDPALIPGIDIHADVSVCITDGWDRVTCFDVLEHVKNDKEFLMELLRISRSSVILTTPNWKISRAVNPHHVREYDGATLIAMVSEFSNIRECRVGDPYGREISGTLSIDEFAQTDQPHLYLELTQ